MPLPKWKAPRLACGYSVTVLLSADWCTACGVCPLRRSRLLWLHVTARCTSAWSSSLGSPLVRHRSSKLRVGSLGLAWACVPLLDTLLVLTWVGACAPTIGDLDPLFSSHPVADLDGALQLYNGASGQVLTKDAALALTQKKLSHQLDSASWDSQVSVASVTGRAILLSEVEPGARASLNAVPHGRTRMEGNCFSHNGRTTQGLHSGGPLMFTFPLLRAPQLRLTWPSLAPCGWSRSRKLDGMPWQLQVSTPTSRSRT